MMDKNREIITELKKHLQAHLGELIRDVILFGSQAKGNSHSDSDYDILIITREKVDWKRRGDIIDLAYDIQLQYEIIFDFLVLGIDELDTLKAKQPIFQNAMQYGIYA